MMRKVLIGIAFVVALAAPASARTTTYFGFQIGISNAPPPPHIVYYDDPDMVYVPDERVYVVEDDYADCDIFRYGSSWYACQGGYWYRAPRYGGPYRVVDVRYVPRPIFQVPARHWKHRYSDVTYRHRYSDAPRYRGRYANDGRWARSDYRRSSAYRDRDYRGRDDWRDGDRRARSGRTSGDWDRGAYRDRNDRGDRGGSGSWERRIGRARDDADRGQDRDRGKHKSKSKHRDDD